MSAFDTAVIDSKKLTSKPARFLNHSFSRTLLFRHRIIRLPNHRHAIERPRSLSTRALDPIHLVPLDIEDAVVVWLAALFWAVAFEETVEPDVRDGCDHRPAH